MELPEELTVEFEVDPLRVGQMRASRDEQGHLVVTHFVTEKALKDAIVKIVKNKEEWNKSK